MYCLSSLQVYMWKLCGNAYGLRTGMLSAAGQDASLARRHRVELHDRPSRLHRQLPESLGAAIGIRGLPVRRWSTGG